MVRRRKAEGNKPAVTFVTSFLPDLRYHRSQRGVGLVRQFSKTEHFNAEHVFEIIDNVVLRPGIAAEIFKPTLKVIEIAAT
ncbi:MAG TPA: hypothetical protein DHU96_12230 [Actinobacteria bacterium]|nr:hypothetical protein [Actinomycetota bacterium]